MSVQDESWNRPVCKFCNQTIGYGMYYKHDEGKCLNNMNIKRNPPGESNKKIKAFEEFKITPIKFDWHKWFAKIDETINKNNEKESKSKSHPLTTIFK